MVVILSWPTVNNMASSGTRNPKELKNIISASKQDVGEMHANLDKLKRLSHDDKTEAAMLRSRIDEQAQLICILKQRADKALIKSQTLERVNKDLEKFREEAQELIDGEIKKCNMLDRRFHELAENHEEMIRFKDEYKRLNNGLKRENQQLRDENANLFSASLEEKDKKIDSQEIHIKSLKDQCKELDRHCSFVQHQLGEKENYYKGVVSKLEEELKSAKEQIKDALTQLKQQKNGAHMAESNQSIRLEKLNRERQEFLELSMQRGKLIQEKQKEIKQLLDKVKEAEKAVRKMEDKFERESAQVSANLQVIKLKGERDDAEEALSELKMEYNAYKRHSADLLAREKSLNSQLRNLVS